MLGYSVGNLPQYTQEMMLMEILDKIKKVLSKKVTLPRIKNNSSGTDASGGLQEIPVRRIVGISLLVLLAVFALSGSHPVKPGKEVETSLILSLFVGGWFVVSILNNLSMIFGHKSFLLDILTVGLFLLSLLAPASEASGAEYSGFTNFVGFVWIFGNVIAALIDAIIIRNEL